MGNSASSLGLVLSAVPVLVHGPESFFPFFSRVVVDWVLPPFGLELPPWSLTLEDQKNMLNAAIEAAPADKWRLAADYVFVLTFEQRQGAIGFVAAAVASAYGLTLPVDQRHPLHFFFMVVALLMAAANANHAGIPFLGVNPMVTPVGRNVGLAFTPFWLLTFYCNYKGFMAGKAKMD